MNLSNSSGTQPDLFGKPPPLTLRVSGIPPSFKNNKMLITKNQHGIPLPEPMLITRPDLQKRMAVIVKSFESQLKSAYQTSADGISMECSLVSWIALHVPADDCWELVPEIQITGELCEPGNEGAEITITPL